MWTQVVENKGKIIVITLTLAGAFFAGRYSTPAKVVVETKTVEVIKVVKDTTVKRKRKKTIVEVVKPDGTKETHTVIDSDTDKQIAEVIKNDKVSETKSETLTNWDLVGVNAMLGLDLNTGKPVYGVSIEKPIIGPMTLGVFLLSNDTAGGQIGIRF